jgi:hypothetical protein
MRIYSRVSSVVYTMLAGTCYVTAASSGSSNANLLWVGFPRFADDRAAIDEQLLQQLL